MSDYTMAMIIITAMIINVAMIEPYTPRGVRAALALGERVDLRGVDDLGGGDINGVEGASPRGEGGSRSTG